VLLPAGYDRDRRRYPVVYVLHGVGDDYLSWINPSRGDLERLTGACQAIFVMPDGGSGPLAGWYSDWKDGSYDYESFHTRVLPQQVDRRFRTQGPRARAVAGLSMGGFGALSYTARHPGMFKATASYSGFVDSQFGAPVSGAFYDVGGQNPVYSLGTPSKNVWGDQTADAAVWAAHNPYALVSRFKGQPLYLSSGHGLPGGSQGDDPTKAANYPTEAYVGQLNDRFASALTAAGIRFTDAREDGGRHDWPYWRANFTKSLKVLMPPLRAATKGCGA
jgi:diacylglycerol O-acyltransferase / trehalose O-mycolyltransferase